MLRLLSFLLLCVALTAGRARADDAPREEAEGHAVLGKVAFVRGDYRAALGEFRAAYTAAPLPELLYNIAHCQELLGDRAAAIETYRRYLAVRPNAEDRESIDAHIRELQSAPQAIAPRPAVAPLDLVATPPSIPPPVEVTRAPRPIYRRWWFWTGIAVVVAAGAAVALALALRPSAPSLGFPGFPVSR